MEKKYQLSHNIDLKLEPLFVSDLVLLDDFDGSQFVGAILGCFNDIPIGSGAQQL